MDHFGLINGDLLNAPNHTASSMRPLQVPPSQKVIYLLLNNYSSTVPNLNNIPVYLYVHLWLQGGPEVPTAIVVTVASFLRAESIYVYSQPEMNITGIEATIRDRRNAFDKSMLSPFLFFLFLFEDEILPVHYDTGKSPPTTIEVGVQ